MMDNVREKLVELLREVQYLGGLEEKLADHMIGNGVTVQEWIPVSEPPKEWRRENGDMINYLICIPEYGVGIGNFGEPVNTWLCVGVPCKPTHWAQLPLPPEVPQ